MTLAAYLAERGFDAGAIGALAAAATLPWTFKWVWGPLIDRFSIPSMGRRRPWIILAQGGMILSIASMTLVTLEPVSTSFWIHLPGVGPVSVVSTQIPQLDLAVLGQDACHTSFFEQLGPQPPCGLDQRGTDIRGTDPPVIR